MGSMKEWLKQIRHPLTFDPNVDLGPPALKPALRGWQIFFILVTAIIGTGGFNDYPRAAATAGPAGLIIAICVIGALSVAVMDGLSEMTQCFPTVNPIVGYVRLYVDPALATCVSYAYWFAYSVFFAIQLTTAASYMKSENDNKGVTVALTLSFFVFAPAVFIMINLRQVYKFGWIETVFGVVKVVIIIIVSGIFLYIAGTINGIHYLTEGVTYSESFTPGAATCLVLGDVAFSFLGLESVAVMTFEARNVSDRKVPSQVIAWFTTFIYIVFAIPLCMCIDWKDSRQTISSFSTDLSEPQHPALVAVAETINGNFTQLTWTLKAMLVFCALSCANTTLYIASRSMYGSALTSDYVSTPLVSHFATATKKGVPKWSIILSGVFWSWLPFVSLSDSPASRKTIAFFNTSGSLCIMFVWGAVCLAYIRYWYWFKLFKKSLPNDPVLRRYNRWNRKDPPFQTLLWWMQPWLAYFGLLGSWILVFVFPSALWWNGGLSASSFFQRYTVPLVIIVSWTALKLRQWRTDPEKSFLEILYVQHDPDDMKDLVTVVNNLTKFMKRSETRPSLADLDKVATMNTETAESHAHTPNNLANGIQHRNQRKFISSQTETT